MRVNLLKKSFETPKGVLTGIQYLRGIAVLMVVLDHTASMFAFPKYFGEVILNDWFVAGAVGVPLFFVISGFIIPFVSLSKITLKPKISTADFFRRRIIRIVPFMWVCILGFASLRILGRGVFPLESYLRSLVLFPVGPVEPKQIWTLRHEFLFYFLFCISVIYFRTKWILYIWFTALFLWSAFHINKLLPDFFLSELIRFVFSRFNILFAAGYFIGISWLKGYFSWTWKTSQGFLISSLSGLILMYFSSLHISWIVDGLISAIVVAVVGLTMTSKGSPGLINRVGLMLGDASYSIYLTHGIFIAAFLGFWSKLQPNANAYAVLVIITIVSCIGGVLIHLYVERPLIIKIQTFLDKRKNSLNSN